MEPSGDFTSWGLFALGIVLLIVILMRRSYRYYGRKGRREKPIKEQFSARGPNKDLPLVDAPPDLIRWQVEMHDTARDLKAELDSKISALRAVTKMANEASQRLEAAIHRTQEMHLHVD